MSKKKEIFCWSVLVILVVMIMYLVSIIPKDNDSYVDKSARCVEYSQGIATFETEDGYLWECEMQGIRKYDVYVITFKTKNTDTLLDDEIVSIK